MGGSAKLSGLLGLLLLQLAAASARADAYQLPNGLRVVLAPDPSVSHVALLVSYDVGSGDDPPQYRGLAHLVEHLTFRDARHPASYRAMDLVEAAGGGANAQVGKDRTLFTSVLPAAALELGLWIESGRMAFALDRIDEDALRLEKKIVRNEIAERDGARDWRMGVYRDRSLYGRAHPYARWDEAELADVAAVTLPDVQWFFQSHYRPDNATLVLVGTFDPEAAKPLIARYFGAIDNPRLQRVVQEAPPPKQCGVHRVALTHSFALGRHLSVTWTLNPPGSPAEHMVLRALQKLLELRVAERFVNSDSDASAVTATLSHRKTHSLLELGLALHETADFAKIEARLMVIASELARTLLYAPALHALRGMLKTEAVRAREDGLSRALAIARGFDNIDDASLAGTLDAVSIQRAAEQLLKGRLVLSLSHSAAQSSTMRVARDEDPCR